MVSIPANFTSLLTCGIVFSGSRHPVIKPFSYFATTLLHAVTAFNTFSLFHTKPFAGEECADLLNSPSFFQTSGSSPSQTYVICSFGQAHPTTEYPVVAAVRPFAYLITPLSLSANSQCTPSIPLIKRLESWEFVYNKSSTFIAISGFLLLFAIHQAAFTIEVVECGSYIFAITISLPHLRVSSASIPALNGENVPKPTPELM